MNDRTVRKPFRGKGSSAFHSEGNSLFGNGSWTVHRQGRIRCTVGVRSCVPQGSFLRTCLLPRAIHHGVYMHTAGGFLCGHMHLRAQPHDRSCAGIRSLPRHHLLLRGATQTALVASIGCFTRMHTFLRGMYQAGFRAIDPSFVRVYRSLRVMLNETTLNWPLCGPSARPAS